MAVMILLGLFLFCGNLYAQQIDREREVTSSQQIDTDKDGLLTRCFDRWGCISIGEPFFSSLRPISLFPVNPDSLDAQFLLVTRSAPDIFQKIRSGNNSSFSQSFFDPLRPVKIIIHGFRESGYQDWIKFAVVQSFSFNVIVEAVSVMDEL
ncbi:inactive pancreatic lipase-related protein 1 [Trichonephila inaurata madagascariensis]|uniref:Inactive pancreatic lipase-related protein 1 n=1 Tax=Trichonephila inaurata madagascariensis TaxID=2747483 RepID=A0A8X6YT04_9ARAC|nr:inactive pancreatic lipase-related protein 1 [Trichonephila inaurata madagascariensis]